MAFRAILGHAASPQRACFQVALAPFTSFGRAVEPNAAADLDAPGVEVSGSRVHSATLEAFRAVSEPTARAMASGALAHSHAQVAASLTGIAGPGGGSAVKPVGPVHFPCAGPGERRVAVERRFGDLGRGAVRLAALEQALALLEEAVD